MAAEEDACPAHFVDYGFAEPDREILGVGLLAVEDEGVARLQGSVDLDFELGLPGPEIVDLRNRLEFLPRPDVSEDDHAPPIVHVEAHRDRGRVAQAVHAVRGAGHALRVERGADGDVERARAQAQHGDRLRPLGFSVDNRVLGPRVDHSCNLARVVKVSREHKLLLAVLAEQNALVVEEVLPDRESFLALGHAHAAARQHVSVILAGQRLRAFGERGVVREPEVDGVARLREPELVSPLLFVGRDRQFVVRAHDDGRCRDGLVGRDDVEGQL